MPRPRPTSQILDGTSRLGNFLAGALIGSLIGAAVAAYFGHSWAAALTGAATGAALIGSLVAAVGTTPEVKAAVAEQNRRISAAEKPLSGGETIGLLDATHAGMHGRVRRLGGLVAVARFLAR